MAEQSRLAAYVTAGDRWTEADPVVGSCFVAFARGGTGPGSAGEPAWAGAAATRGRTLVATVVVEAVAGGPYARGLLALREGPPLEQVVRALPSRPDVLLVPATGRDHPRRCGLATHLGAVVGVPSVGVTHRPLEATGEWPGPRRGARSPLRIGRDVVGAWVRTVSGAHPVAVSPGWSVGVDDACALVLATTKRRRTPEPIRHARHAARVARHLSGAAPAAGRAR